MQQVITTWAITDWVDRKNDLELNTQARDLRHLPTGTIRLCQTYDFKGRCWSEHWKLYIQRLADSGEGATVGWGCSWLCWSLKLLIPHLTPIHLGQTQKCGTSIRQKERKSGEGFATGFLHCCWALGFSRRHWKSQEEGATSQSGEQSTDLISASLWLWTHAQGWRAFPPRPHFLPSWGIKRQYRLSAFKGWLIL